MAGKTPPKAVASFLKPLRRAIDCVTKTALSVPIKTTQGIEQVLFLGNGQAIRLKTTETTDIYFTLTMRFKVVKAEKKELGKFKVQTTSYFYRIADSDKELVSYHWHPESTPDIWFPHVHLNCGKFKKTHFPTGRVSIEEVIRLLICEFKVKAKGGWENVLMETQKRFEQYRTWSSVPKKSN